MQRKLTEKELQFLNDLANDSMLLGKGILKRFIIRNSYEPKYKVGDFVKVTDKTATYIYGNRIVNIPAKITDVQWFLGPVLDLVDCRIVYSLEVIDQFNEKHSLIAEEYFNGKKSSRYIVELANDNHYTFE